VRPVPGSIGGLHVTSPGRAPAHRTSARAAPTGARPQQRPLSSATPHRAAGWCGVCALLMQSWLARSFVSVEACGWTARSFCSDPQHPSKPAQAGYLGCRTSAWPYGEAGSGGPLARAGAGLRRRPRHSWSCTTKQVGAHPTTAVAARQNVLVRVQRRFDGFPGPQVGFAPQSTAIVAAAPPSSQTMNVSPALMFPSTLSGIRSSDGHGLHDWSAPRACGRLDDLSAKTVRISRPRAVAGTISITIRAGRGRQTAPARRRGGCNHP
jgi:hypothetical protein